MSLLDVQDLVVRFRTHDETVHAVNGVSLKLDEGETLGLVGESGCGKSVTSLAMMRLLPQPAGRIEGGRITFDGIEITKATEAEMRSLRGRRLAMIFQDPMTSLNPVLTIEEQIVETILAHDSVSAREASNRAAELLGMVAIPRGKDRLRDFPYQFSGGMRQRVMIAMSLALRPKLLIADEPTTALDVTVQAQVLELIAEVTSRSRTATILITHNLGVVAGRTQRVSVMYAGFVVETGATTAVFAHPGHPYTVGLLHSLPRLNAAQDEPLIPIGGEPPDQRQPPIGCPFAPRCAWRLPICWIENPVLLPVGESPGSAATGPYGTHRTACHNIPTLPEAAAGVPLRPGFRPAPSPGSRTVEPDVTESADTTVAAAAEQPSEASLGARTGETDDPMEAARFVPEPGNFVPNSRGRDIELVSTEGRQSASLVAETQTPSKPLVQLDAVKVYFPVSRRSLFARRAGDIRAVDGISLAIRRGETLGLVGESGCGKSTAGRALLQLYTVTSGRILFDGIDLAKLAGEQMRRMRKRMQMIFQDPYASLNPRMTARAIVAEPLDIHGVGMPRQRREVVDELLATVGIRPAYGGRYPHEFSGGQRQRIGVARALALRPDFIVADEPVSALDVSIQAQIVNLLAELQRRFGLTYLFIAHDLSVIRHVSDRIAVMYLGRIVEIIAASDLGRPLHPYTVALLSAVPIPDPAAERRRRRIILTGEVPSPIAPPAGCRFHTRCWLRTRLGNPVRCVEEDPALRTLGADHDVACHFAESTNG